jgi:hypothetical protein
MILQIKYFLWYFHTTREDIVLNFNEIQFENKA